MGTRSRSEWLAVAIEANASLVSAGILCSRISLVLQKADVPVGELDWIICNGGADIWHQLPERDGKEATWVADEQWEGHIGFR